MRLRKVHDWQARLAEVFTERASDAFEWGRNDCALFAADCIEAMTGLDPAAEYRGTYDDERGALRIVVDGSMEELADRWFPRLPSVASASVGDVGLVMVPETRLEAFAVCGGGGWYLPAARGLAVYQNHAARIAWGVGK